MQKRPHSVGHSRRRSVADLPDFTQPTSGLPSVAVRQVVPVTKKPAVEPTLPPYRPVSGRLRSAIVVLTLVTVVSLAALMLRPQLRLLAAKAERAAAAEQAACPPDAASAAPGCPGSRMPVRMQPAAPLADSARR